MTSCPSHLPPTKQASGEYNASECYPKGAKLCILTFRYTKNTYKYINYICVPGLFLDFSI